MDLAGMYDVAGIIRQALPLFTNEIWRMQRSLMITWPSSTAFFALPATNSMTPVTPDDSTSSVS